MRSLRLLISLTALTSTLFAESAYEHEGKQLREQRDKALAAAQEPINVRYKDMLEALLRRATQANDLDGALVVKKELEDAWSVLPYPKILAEVNWTSVKGGTILLKADKTIVTSWGLAGATWKYLGNNKLIIILPGIDTWILDPSGQFCTDQHGARWNRAK